MLERRPKIEIIDGDLVHLTATIAIPRRFRATFEDAWSTVIEIDSSLGRPQVRSLTMSTSTGDLAHELLRPPVRSVLAPAAIRAASMSLIRGEQSGQRMALVPVSRRLGTGTVGPIQLYGRLHGQAQAYTEAADNATKTRVGRPRLQVDVDELRAIVVLWTRKRSISDIVRSMPMSRSTAYRRVEQARQLGLMSTTEGVR